MPAEQIPADQGFRPQVQLQGVLRCQPGVGQGQAHGGGPGVGIVGNCPGRPGEGIEDLHRAAEAPLEIVRKARNGGSGPGEQDLGQGDLVPLQLGAEPHQGTGELAIEGLRDPDGLWAEGRLGLEHGHRPGGGDGQRKRGLGGGNPGNHRGFGLRTGGDRAIQGRIVEHQFIQGNRIRHRGRTGGGVVEDQLGERGIVKIQGGRFAGGLCRRSRFHRRFQHLIEAGIRLADLDPFLGFFQGHEDLFWFAGGIFRAGDVAGVGGKGSATLGHLAAGEDPIFAQQGDVAGGFPQIDEERQIIATYRARGQGGVVGRRRSMVDPHIPQSALGQLGEGGHQYWSLADHAGVDDFVPGLGHYPGVGGEISVAFGVAGQFQAQDPGLAIRGQRHGGDEAHQRGGIPQVDLGGAFAAEDRQGFFHHLIQGA